MFFMFEKTGKLPSDPFYDEINPFEKLWLYESWVNKIEQDAEYKKSLAILTGGFYNPELAKKMIDKSNPAFVSSDDDFEKSWEMVQKDKENNETTKKKRRKKRRVIK